MKKIFTLAIASMIAIASFAQAPASQKAARSNKVEHVMNVNAMNQEYKNAKALEAAKAEKAAVANEAGATVVRKSAQKPGFAQAQIGNVRTIANANVSNRQVSPLKSKTAVGKVPFRATAGVTPKFGKPVITEEVTEDLTKEMFHTWTSADATAELAAVQSGTWCDYVLNESTGMPYGNGNVDWMQYANLSDYKALKVVATDGTPRFFLNRMTANGQANTGDAIDTNNGDHFAAYVTKEMNEDSVSYTFTLDVAKIVAEQGFAHLNVIKGGNWANVTVTSMTLVKEQAVEVEYTDYEADGAMQQYYAADNDWYCGLLIGNNTFYFDIVVGEDHKLVPGHEYTLDDMLADYSFAKINGRNYLYDACTYCSNEDGSFVEAYAVIQGTGFHITWTKPAIPEITAYETVEFSVAQTQLVDLTADMGLFQVVGDNGEQYVGVAIWSNQLAGTYTIDDVYMDYTNLYLTAEDYTGVKPFAIAATVTDEVATIVYDAYNGTEYTLIFHLTEGGSGDEPTDVTVTKDEHGIITSVSGGEKKIYNRQGTAYLVQGSSMTYTEQSGTATIIEDGDVVYLEKPVSEYTTGAWVAGYKEGNTYVFPAKQPLNWSASYSATMSMRWGVITAAGNINVTDAEDNFVYVVEGNQLILQGTESFATAQGDAPFMGVFWDDDNSATGYGDAETVLTYDPDAKPASTDLVTPPASLVASTWYLNGKNVTSDGATPLKNRNVQVGFDGSDIYVQGLFAEFPTAWVKGTVAGDVVTFENLQFVGNYAGYNIWMVGAYDETGLGQTYALCDAIATYDAEAQALYFDTEILANAKETEIYYLEWIQDAVITAEEPVFEEPIITELTATLPYFNSFDSEAEQAEVGIYDANEDGSTFTFAAASGADNDTPALRYRYNASNMGDDYAVMPGLQLEAGNPYKVSIDVRSYSATWPEAVEVLAGRVAKASQLLDVVVESMEVATGEYQTVTATFVPEESGIYYFAIHAISEPDQFYLYVDNFSVKENNMNAPAAPSDLELLADENAELSVAVKVNAPAKTVGGADIDGQVGLDIKRDGELIKTLSVAAGAAAEFVDNTMAAPGFYNYSVSAYTASATTGIAYSWESPEGEVIEQGGSIAYVNGDGTRVNYPNAGYYTVCLNGKKANLNDETASANAGHMVITLDNPLHEGDQITMTAYRNKNADGKTASVYMLFENGTVFAGVEGGMYWTNILSDENNADYDNDGDTPNSYTWTVPAAEEGAKTITLTRNDAATNLFITKIEIKSTVEGDKLYSDPVSAKVYVGEDIPTDVENLAAADKNENVLLTWTAPTKGENGGIVKAENLKYNVYPVEMVEFWGMQFPEIDFENPYMTGVTSTEANVEFDTNTGVQQYTYFGVTAANEAGESGGALAALLTGEAYALPFHESFDGGTLAYWWGVDYNDNIYDADGGLGLTAEGEMVFQAPVAGWIELYSGKINLGNVANPTLSFTYMSDAAVTMEVIAYDADKEVSQTVNVPASAEVSAFAMKLTEFAGSQWMRFTVRVVTTGAANVFVDNFNVLDLYSDNLTIALSAPAKIVAGQSAVVKATVQNEGENVAEGYSVKFYLNDVEMPAPMFETPALAFFETAEFEIELATSVFDEAGDITVKAEVVYAADLKAEDNTDEAVVTIAAPSAQPVATVAAEETADGNLAISWTLVAGDGVAENTEDFEAYEGNTIYANGATLGDWKGLDLSQGSSYGWSSSSIAWNYTGEAYAFGIMNFETVGLSATMTANSGAQALMFMSEVDPASSAGITSNKYLISSELPGVAQTISFMALPMTTQYGAEVIEVMASSTTDDVNAFTVVEKFNIAVESWTEYTASLPEGTKYFALHYVSTDIFALFIDDVKYMTSGTSTPTGFNVYIDENLVATAAADALSYTYTDEISAGEHSVAVTALYGDKESAPVLASVTTAIENIAALKSFNIYNAAGVLVRKNATSFNGLEAGVYVVNGVKVTVK